MKSIIWISRTLIIIFISIGTNAYKQDDRNLNLETEDSYGSYGFGNGFYGHGGYGLTGYGSGGYGDPTVAPFNLRVCTSRTVDQSKCTNDYPETEPLEWRFIKNIGWRKFTPYGAARKDWSDFKKTIGWPFNRRSFWF